MKQDVSIMSITGPGSTSLGGVVDEEDAPYYRCARGHITRSLGLALSFGNIQRHYCLQCMVRYLDTFLYEADQIDPCEDLSPKEMDEL